MPFFKIAGLGLLALIYSSYSFADEARNLSDQDKTALNNGSVISEIWRDKSRKDGALEAYAAIHIQASPEQIWAVMTSCELSVEIVKNMTACHILEASPDGAWDIREQRFRAPFPLGGFRTEFRTDFTPFRRMNIQRSGGDMKVQDGIWQIETLEPGYSRVTYQARVALKIPVPRFLMRRALRKDTPELMENLRNAAEKIAGASQQPTAVISDGTPPH